MLIGGASVKLNYYKVFSMQLCCPKYGGEMKFISFINEYLVIRLILKKFLNFGNNFTIITKYLKSNFFSSKIRGQLESSRPEWFEGLAITPVEERCRYIDRTVSGQSALHGCLKDI